ncbi:MAG: hypothetical protein HQK86_11145 [Nitrospinae bacterium]|nr:hypothetical protein [Nitrospinota bacterium]MBF0634092.1 hypothetical protein [Nitrospinota bacterium]
MLLHLFTAGVLLASVSIAWALISPGTLKVGAMSVASAVRFRGKLSVVGDFLNSVHNGAFVSGLATPHLFHAPRLACVDDVRLALTQKITRKNSLGFNGYPPYRR